MIVQLDEKISSEQLDKLSQILSDSGFKPNQVKTQIGRYLVAIGKGDIDLRKIGHHAGVKDVHRVSDAYKLVSRKWKVGSTAINLANKASIGAGSFCFMAGPCSIEGEAQIRNVVAHLVKNNIKVMRGGAFKPRTSPYTFRGLGIDGLKMFHSIAHENGLQVISEVVAATNIQEMYDYVDIYQVGTRNSQNFQLLHELGQVDKPVLIKRGMSGTLEELLQAAEYVFSNGNERLILCERGIRTYEKAYRNTLDLNAVPVLKAKTHLPVVVDPSHGIGIRAFVEPMALAAVAAGADGLLYEIHESPEEALSDGDQTLNFEESERLISKSRRVFNLLAS